MKLVVGLGNPGPEYADTRHNAGALVVERFAARHGIALDARRFHSRLGLGRLAPEPGTAGEPLELALLAPETFMNRSGGSVAAALAGLPVGEPAEDLLLVFDDVDLPFGRLRLRPGGGAGGHRGLADVIGRLGRRDLPRLRVGVGRPSAGLDTTDHVLGPFSEEERERLPALLERACEAVACALRRGLAPAMNAFNRDPEGEGSGDDG